METESPQAYRVAKATRPTKNKNLWWIFRRLDDVTRPLPPFPTDRNYMTTRELGKRWGVTADAILSLRYQDLAPTSYRIGGSVVWRVRDIQYWETTGVGGYRA